MAKRIYLSPSDQTANRYAYGNTNEAAQCRKIAKACLEALVRCGFEAKTNYADGADAMYERVNESNTWGADLHVCIHTNAGGGKGAEVFVSKKDEAHLKAAQPICDELKKISPHGISRGVKTASYYEIKYTTALCTYIEVDFHDNADIARWIVENTTAIAEAICRGICTYFGVKYVAGGAQTPAEPTAPANETVSIKLDVLGRSDKGDQVKTIQRILRSLGYKDADNEALKIDGSFGPRTEYAVRRYQTAKKLSVDGIVGKNTWKKLLG